MRLAPLIPLLALALGAGVVEVLRLEHSRGFGRQFSASISGAQVTGSADDMQLEFSARRMALAPEGNQATDVRGRLQLSSGTRDFSADSMFSEAAGGDIVFAGDVTMWQGEALLRADKITVAGDGSMAGDNATLESGSSVVTADALSIGADGELKLAGSVRTRIAQ